MSPLGPVRGGARVIPSTLWAQRYSRGSLRQAANIALRSGACRIPAWLAAAPHLPERRRSPWQLWPERSLCPARYSLTPSLLSSYNPRSHGGTRHAALLPSDGARGTDGNADRLRRERP